MAKLRMKKIELIAPLTDSKKIIELLQRRGVVELSRTEDECLEQTNVTAVTGSFDKFRATAVQALDTLEKYAPEKTALTDMLGGRTEVEKHDFGKRAAQLEKTMNIANEILRCGRTVTDCDAERQQLAMRCDTLRPWLALDVPLNFHGTDTTTAFIGTVPYPTTADDLEAKLPEGTSVEVVLATKEHRICSCYAATTRLRSARMD